MSTFQIADVRFQISMAIGRNSDIMKDRTKRFAIQAKRFCRSLPCSSESTIVVRQLVRSAASAGANYRAVCRARSGADFISKRGIVLEEADETLVLVGIARGEWRDTSRHGAPLLREANELVSIFVASLRTAKGV